MKIQSLASHEQKPVAADGARNARMRMLIGPEDGATNFHMRHFEIGPGGNTPHHAHDHEHEILVLSGRGIAKTTQGDRPFQAGDVIFVPANETHAFFNASDERCEFICLIPAPRSQTP